MRLALVMGAMLTVAATASGAPPSPVVYPVQQLPLSFSHSRHLAIGGVGCGTCHEAAAASRRAADRLVPPEAACATCHAIDRQDPNPTLAPGAPPARCDACHPGWDGLGAPPTLAIPTANLRFNHQVHISRGQGCVSCHGDLLADKVGLATRAQLPRMASCLGCHDGATAPAACTTCHPGDRDGRLRTVFPEGKLIPSGLLRGDAHDLRFRNDHAAVARSDDKYCASCHTRRYCLDCHDGVAKPLDIHANDYVALHAVDARRNATECAGCHRLQTFCTGCHARSGVSDDPKTSQFERLSKQEPATNRFHPPGWWTTNDPNLRSGDHHSFDAQRNLRACASCHREDFCRDCHAQSVNPHPAGWAQSSRCRSLLARAGRTCLRCHTRVEDARCE